MLNTKFKTTNTDENKKMTELYSQIFAVLMNIGRPILPTVIWLNDNFEEIYTTFNDEEATVKYIFAELKVSYIENN